MTISDSFWATYIPPEFVTKISDWNPGHFVEKGVRNHIFVDSCSPIHFSRRNVEGRKKVNKIVENKKRMF